MPYTFNLKFVPAGQLRKVQLRPICGSDELAVENADTANAVLFLNNLITVAGDSDSTNIRAEHLVAADRDHLLAVVYRHTYGPGIESTVTCRHCKSIIDISFSLNDLISHMHRREETVLKPDESGVFSMENGCRFRLPSGLDEMAISGLSVEEAERELLQRCIVQGDATAEGESVQKAMEEIAPVLQTEMIAQCPECEKEQQVFFDIQTFLLTRIKNGRKRLIREVHHIAAAYHWSQAEILNLPTSLRMAYATMIESGSTPLHYFS